ncbi:MAG TPA: MFS transporter [Candidatus Acidoferrum sp.]|jgi:sugar phosphate permease|nr:MFS transporter [Candidatus Acidoferrum sp.]
MHTRVSATAVGTPLRWVMWGIPAFLFLIGFFHRAAPGVIARDLMHAFDATGTTIGLLAATYFYSYAALMVPAGLLLDAFGARRVLAVGGAVMGIGALIMGAATSTPPLFAGRLLVGAGASVTFVGTLKIAATWFPPARFGFLAALSATVGVLGSLVSTLPLAALVARVGWRGAFWGVGLVTLLATVVCVGVVRDRPSTVTLAPAVPGFAPVLAGIGQVLRNPHTWPPFLAFFCLYTVAGNQALWMVPYLRDVYGLGLTPAAFYAMATSLALLVSGPLTGFASDRIVGRRKAVCLALSTAQFALWIVFVATLGTLSLGAVHLLLFVMGLAGGAFVLVWPIGREVNPPNLDGVAVAVVNFGGFLGAALTQGPIGALLDARWTGALVDGARRYPVEAYRGGFGVCAGFAGAAALLCLLMRETRGRNIYGELRGGALREPA